MRMLKIDFRRFSLFPLPQVYVLRLGLLHFIPTGTYVELFTLEIYTVFFSLLQNFYFWHTNALAIIKYGFNGHLKYQIY